MPKPQNIGLLILALAIPLIALLPVPDFWITQLNMIGMYSMTVLGLILLTGVGGLTSFGQAAFVGIGAYTTAWLTLNLGMSPWLTLFIGMGLTAGLGFTICLRLLGVGTQVPLSSFRILFRVFWIGFYINLLSGTLLFMTDATGIARVWELYAKLACLVLVLLVMSRLRRFIDSDESDGVIPPQVRQMAYACIVLWLAVITSGRLIAYAVEANGATI